MPVSFASSAGKSRRSVRATPRSTSSNATMSGCSRLMASAVRCKSTLPSAPAPCWMLKVITRNTGADLCRWIMLQPDTIRKPVAKTVANKARQTIFLDKITGKIRLKIFLQQRFQFLDGLGRPNFPVGHDGVLQGMMARPVRLLGNLGDDPFHHFLGHRRVLGEVFNHHFH